MRFGFCTYEKDRMPVGQSGLSLEEKTRSEISPPWFRIHYRTLRPAAVLSDNSSTSTELAMRRIRCRTLRRLVKTHRTSRIFELKARTLIHFLSRRADVSRHSWLRPSHFPPRS